VFGVSSYEYLQYAMNNRSEWESRGKEIVAEMKEQAAGMAVGTHQPLASVSFSNPNV
jgi:hypothetical protein